MAEDVASELRALKEDVAALRAELGRISGAAGEGGEAVPGAGARLRDALQRAYEGIRDRSQDVLDKGRDKVRDYPLTTAFVALLAGVVIGMLLRRSRE